MKLLRTRIENFRLLKEVEIDFSTEEKRNLTVIRAANESGKTTLLHALQWGLFGDRGLPDGGSNFRLSPLDASRDGKASTTVSVEVDYEILGRIRTQTYRLVRSVTEKVQEGKYARGSGNVHLYRMGSNGAEPLDHAEAHIPSHLPMELREVFFTDGDRALRFIEGGDQTKRVENAIRSLLGLGVIEAALGHVRAVGNAINRKIPKGAGGGKQLDEVTKRLAQLQEEIPDLEEEIKEARETRMNLDDLASEADGKLAEALRKGNKEELEKRKEEAVRGRKLAEEDSRRTAQDHTILFQSKLLGKHLLAEPFAEAKGLLERMRDQGKIPSQTIPVLEERLNQPDCICGESLDTHDVDGKKRRENIQRLIEQSRNSDEIQAKVTALYYSAQELLAPVGDRTWADKHTEAFARRQDAEKRRKHYGLAEAEAEAKIAQIPDIDIRQLRNTRDRYLSQSRDARDQEIRLNSRLESKRRESQSLEADRAKLLGKNKQGAKFVAELEVAQDLQDIMGRSLERMKTSELRKVSEKMNDLFLGMIGADASQSAVIIRAEITPDFKIVVFGQHEQPLDPSQDLNGASRRALTIAFILALTKVSEVNAPNVIDTPLGMAAGFVKTAILQYTVLQSSQLILFLTHDEIKGCEDILDAHAGRVYTFTNPAHYPKILINKPHVKDTRVLLCECGHRRHCKICERRETITAKKMNTEKD